METGYGKADAHRLAPRRLRIDRGIDADEVAARVDQRAARIARVVSSASVWMKFSKVVMPSCVRPERR